MPAFSSTGARRPPRATKATLATNLLAPFLLTQLLLPRLRKSAASRIINVSSGGMYTAGIAMDDLQYEKTTYNGSRAYARTKRALVVLTALWADQLKENGVVVHAMRAGWADTPGVASWLPGFHAVTRRLLRTPEQGSTRSSARGITGSGQGKRWVLLDRERHVTQSSRHRSDTGGATAIVGGAHQADHAEQGTGRRSLIELREPCAPTRWQLSTHGGSSVYPKAGVGPGLGLTAAYPLRERNGGRVRTQYGKGCSWGTGRR